MPPAALEEAVLVDLRRIRKSGWYRFSALSVPTLADLCPAGKEETAEDAIRRVLLALLDPPPRDGKGRELPRVPLTSRSRRDQGLFNRVLFGEPGRFTLPATGTVGELTLNPKDTKLGQRYRDLGVLWGVSGDTIQKLPKQREPEGGLAYRAMRDVAGRLLADPAGKATVGLETATARANIDKPLDRRRRIAAAVTLGLAAAVSVVAVWALSSGDPPDTRADSRTGAVPITTNTVGYGFGVRVRNEKIDRSWAASIRADPTDRLRFRLRIDNLSRLESPRLVAWVLGPTAVRDRAVQLKFVVATSNGTVLTEKLSTTLRYWGWLPPNELAVLPHPVTVRDRTLKHLRTVFQPLDGYTIPERVVNDYINNRAEVVHLGKVAPSTSSLVDFVADWYLGSPTREPFGRTRLRFGPQPDKAGADWTVRERPQTVRVGDRLRFLAHLDNQTSQEGEGTVRVATERRAEGRALRVRVLGRLHYSQEMELASATLNSSDGQPIRLAPIPGTTVLRPRPAASARSGGPCVNTSPDRRLADGIFYGGVSIGRFGGFTPHSTCAGTDKNRWLVFDAVVASA